MPSWGASLDLAFQLALNDGNWSCVSWSQVGAAGAFGAIGGGFASGAFKLTKGSMKWSNAGRRYRRLHNVPGKKSGNPHEVHHWAIERNSKIGKRVPDSIKNHPWNLKSIPESAHKRIHGNHPVLPKYDPVSAWWHGSPEWAKGCTGFSGSGINKRTIR